MRSQVFISIGCAVAFAGCGMLTDEKPVIVVQACSIDTLGGASGEPLRAPVRTKLVAMGWAADTLGTRVGEEVLVHLVSQQGKVQSTGKRSAVVPRPDVAKQFNLPSIEVSGFHAYL